MHDGTTNELWPMSSATYIAWSIADVAMALELVGEKLKMRAGTPMTAGYRPELDAMPELDKR